jgi:alkaline phosphatase D
MPGTIFVISSFVVRLFRFNYLRMFVRSLFCLALLAQCSTLFAQQGKPNSTAKTAPQEEVEIADLESYKPKPIDTLTVPTVIAFGSCNKLDKPQTMWDAVNANNPGLWIWLGDIIYADTTDMKALAKMYKTLKNTPNYKKMREKTQVIGVYDDHDYGANDAGKTFPKKKQSKKCLMDFLDVPLKAPVRQREGAYNSYTFGKGAQTVKVIILDTRYFRDSLVADPTKQRRYIPNTTGDMLGEAQWAWLESELKNSKANLNIISTSIQVLADEHGHEKWGNFPNCRKRLLSLIVKTHPKNALVISGDRHMAEISKMDITGLPYPLYDFTSSGMTHIRSGTTEANKLRVGDMIVKKNFGLLKIQWNNDKPTVTMQVRGLQNELFQEVVVKY